ncbi:MAG: hypothetical protein HY243_00750 [Proteobacteria bacterium]|nr:hypothetical protein [Pseudomonadota bacterium]
MGERDATADSKAINKILDLPCWNRRAASAKVPGMNADPLSTWLGFLASPTAPKTAMSPSSMTKINSRPFWAR